ncbi:GAF domain-containing sensor histidine kinase [Luteimonas sp BLCC-B24]|uniref:sensor histidine kinase n=1 Tax=Luteimonas sp. BLCC-B24 TaxID=3025317 RepID=UPI00234CC954|nr:GAF domain-containing sensor histidine kinase [Luteimonas sp. BLCC-B24]MDC7808366.1 GAF domain-containing sensor histidine kinase [Luteimonas sp. BLCC-B24]
MHPSAAKLPPHIEARRVESLHAYGILDTPVEAVFEDITRIASAVCQTPIAVITLVDAERQWFKSEVGLGVRETPLETSICAHAILEHDVLEVPDTTRDARFASNPLVTGDPRLRFYAGALLKTPDGLPLGTVCVLDTRPRSLTSGQIDTLRALSRQVMAQLELRRLLAEAHAVSEHRARVLASAGHDLKTPLRAALYAIRRTRVGASDAQRQTLDSAEQELTAIDQTFGELIASATGRGGFVPPALQAIDVVPVVEQVAAAWARAAARKPVAFELRIESACRARTHAGLLDTLLGNLVSNAFKYTPAGGRVELVCRQVHGLACIDVVDTGIGMDPARVEGYFKAFQQGDARSEGLGIGLWIVRQTAEALAADLDVASALGEGTRITLRLPSA